MSFFKSRKCIECGAEYSPTSCTQKYCIVCGKKNCKKIANKAAKKYRDKYLKEVK